MARCVTCMRKRPMWMQIDITGLTDDAGIAGKSGGLARWVASVSRDHGGSLPAALLPEVVVMLPLVGLR